MPTKIEAKIIKPEFLTKELVRDAIRWSLLEINLPDNGYLVVLGHEFRVDKGLSFPESYKTVPVLLGNKVIGNLKGERDFKEEAECMSLQLLQRRNLEVSTGSHLFFKGDTWRPGGCTDKSGYLVVAFSGDTTEKESKDISRQVLNKIIELYQTAHLLWKKHIPKENIVGKVLSLALKERKFPETGYLIVLGHVERRGKLTPVILGKQYIGHLDDCKCDVKKEAEDRVLMLLQGVNSEDDRVKLISEANIGSFFIFSGNMNQYHHRCLNISSGGCTDESGLLIVAFSGGTLKDDTEISRFILDKLIKSYQEGVVM
jgi:hypothetical protein